MTDKPNILIVCGKNKKRSKTAEYIFKNDPRFHIRSVGLSPKSDRKLSEKDLIWASLVMVMEEEQKVRIKDIYGHMDIPRIEILYIPDDYNFMDTELVAQLEDKINAITKLVFLV